MGDQDVFSLEKVKARFSSETEMESNHEDLSLRKARSQLTTAKEMGIDRDQDKAQTQSVSQKEREFSLKASPLEQSLQVLLGRRRQQSTLRQLTLPRPNQIDFSSNDFLSLSTSPILKATFIQELSSSQLPTGSGGSRLLDGNSRFAEDLEQLIARFHNASSGLLFNSGFDANAGFFSCVPQPGDIIVYDSLIHASVHDGMRLSRASATLPFAHNSVEDLRRVLLSCLADLSTIREGQNHVIIAVEAVYSMDGDLAPLKEIIEVVETVLPPGTGYVVVDEAHSTGVLGPNGRGLVCELGLEEKIFARLHTFGKSLACNGGAHPPVTFTRLNLFIHMFSSIFLFRSFLSPPSGDPSY
jgi:8-amino-7-oxononanoate synthase